MPDGPRVSKPEDIPRFQRDSFLGYLQQEVFHVKAIKQIYIRDVRGVPYLLADVVHYTYKSYSENNLEKGVNVYDLVMAQPEATQYLLDALTWNLNDPNLAQSERSFYNQALINIVRL